DGRFIDGANQIMIGKEAAELLDVKAGDKLILLTTNVYGSMSAVEPEIVGIYHSLNDIENSTFVLADLTLSQKLLGLEGRVTEISLELTSHEYVDEVLPIVKNSLGIGYDVTSWKENQASLISMLEISKIGMGILSAIILIVAALGMINTFLISVLERLPEFGTLRAIGLRSSQLMVMVVVQGLFLGIIGTIAGLIIGLPVVFYFQAHPFDLGEAMQGIEGIDSLLWFAFRWDTTIWITVLGIAIAIFASLYPAYYVGKQKPVDVLRNIA
ncbi:ABC transporter permease, partial [bacterium]